MTRRFGLRVAIIASIAALASMSSISISFAQDALSTIRSKGLLRVGVKTDYKPFGFLDASGKPVGIELDLAQDLADKLGVKLEVVSVQSANRIEFLQQGRIDLIIATMSDNAQRRQVVGIVQPFYYAGGTAVLVRKAAKLKSWESLRGQKICGTQGAYYNRAVTEKYGVELVAFAGTTEALSALSSANCIAFVQDSTLLQSIVASDPAFADYETPLPVEDIQPWALAVAKSEVDGPLGKFMSETVTDWHRSGKLLDEERKWGLPTSKFLQDNHASYAK
jgi:polar amino acid transport system substrate-binding protein